MAKGWRESPAAWLRRALGLAGIIIQVDKLETALLGSNQTQVLGGEIREPGWSVVSQLNLKS